MGFAADWNVPSIIDGRSVLEFWRFDSDLAARTNVFGLAICDGGPNSCVLVRCEDDWMPLEASVHPNVGVAEFEALREFAGSTPVWAAGNRSMIDNLSLADDLESLLVGALDAAQLRRKYGAGVASPTLEALWPNLDHYLDDADIGTKDVAYRDMQDSELRKLIQLLRQRAPIDALRRITFLRST